MWHFSLKIERFGVKCISFTPKGKCFGVKFDIAVQEWSILGQNAASQAKMEAFWNEICLIQPKKGAIWSETWHLSLKMKHFGVKCIFSAPKQKHLGMKCSPPAQGESGLG